jgi:hypothetical protein
MEDSVPEENTELRVINMKIIQEIKFDYWKLVIG